MTPYTSTAHAPSTLVREGYTDDCVWRAALGPAEPLRPFAMLGGPLDAPEWIPAGGACSRGLLTTQRAA